MNSTVFGPDKKSRPLSRLGSHVVAAILLNQRINDEAAIETAQNDHTG
jgi:hypothetical protein